MITLITCLIFSDVVTGDCRDVDNWSHEKGEEDTPKTSQECPDNEVMVGITKSYFVDTGDDDWKYKIRCCKVSHRNPYSVR